MDILDWLTEWFKLYCDGEWEHGYGIKIETLDNPGWSIEISLQYTVPELFMKDFQLECVSRCVISSKKSIKT